MIYVLLIIIIALLLIIIYSKRDRGAHFNKLFSPIKGVQDFKKDDIRNQTHPEEIVKYKNFRYVKRREALMLDEFGFIPEEDSDVGNEQRNL
jgi:hypothetical protein